MLIVIVQKSKFFLKIDDGNFLEAEIIESSPELDFAVLKVKKTDRIFAKLSVRQDKRDNCSIYGFFYRW